VERGSATGRALAEGRTVHIADVDSDPDYTFAEAKALGGFRTILAIPMLRDGRAIGVLALTRREHRPFTEKQIELLAGFADQAAIAIENVRLFEAVQARTAELTEALQQQTATGEVLSVISRSTTDLQPVLDSIASTAVRLCEANYTHIYKLADDGYYYLVAAKGVEESYSKPLFGTPFGPDRGSLAGRAALERRTVHIPNILEDPQYTLRIGKQRSGLGVPLLRHGVPIGVIVLLRTDIKPFTERQIELVTTFADQAVIAIENVRLFGELQARTAELSEALQQQTATADVLKAIAGSAFDLDAVLYTLVKSAIALCRASGGNIHLRDRDVFRPAMQVGWPTEFLEFMNRNPIKPDMGSVSGRAVMTASVVRIPDVLADPLYGLSAGQKIAGYRSVLGVPLIRDGEVVGVFSLGRGEVDPFSDREAELVQMFSDQAVIAIENARLFNELEVKNQDLSTALEQQTATSAILRVIASSPTDLAPVLSAVAENAARLCGADDAQIFRVQDDMLRLEASFGSIPIHFREQRIGRGWVTGRSVVDRRTIHVHDLAAESEDEYPVGRAMQHQHGHHTTLATPLLKQGTVLGAILIRRLEIQPFSNDQIRLLETFADQAAIAVENVRLFTEVEARTRELTESLEQQTATSEILRAISTSMTDVQPVFETIVRNAVSLCGSLFANVFRYDGELIHFAASHNTGWDFVGLLRAEYPMRPDFSQVTGRAVLTRAVVRLEDALADAEYDQRFALGWRRMLGIPMLSQGLPVGVIVVGWAEAGPIPARQEELLKIFADQAVIAIENARLVQALEAALSEFNAVLDNIDYGVLFMDKDLRARIVNPALRRLWNIPQDILDRRPTVQELFEYNRDRGVYTTPPDKWDEWVAARVQRIRDGNIPPGEFVRADGKVYTYQCVALPDGGRMLSYFDITELKNRQAELMAAKEAAETALADLRTAQERLVHTEKLASLGHLTAGIAHEIKNPLNFVNNFASLSGDLLVEIEATLAAPIAALGAAERDEAEDLLRTVRDNLGKIVHHGRRADSIVRNMLLHARHGSGEWRPADINAIAEEALNLAYHGARASHPDFNVEIVKHLDPAAGAIECCPQDVLRVILNLVSNGIYAANMKRPSARPGFVPRIDVTTRAEDACVTIEVRDNGTGIPSEIRDSVFLPFFTTKPAGEGTGLGLSLSHDIVVKQHNGSFSVESEPGEFTSFSVVLPRHGVGGERGKE
jgi:GAF domain-containing protein/nitrogen-specific signal transduction histidine kinase